MNKVLEKYTIAQLLEEVAIRVSVREYESIENWCHDCEHFIAPSNKQNPCARGYEMKFHAPRDYSELDSYGHYKEFCTDRIVVSGKT